MALDNAKGFLKSVESNASLADSIQGKQIGDIVAIALAHGFTVSAEELRAASDELYGDLSEEELSNIAGGRCRMP